MAIGHRILPLCAAALLVGAQSAWAHDHHGANMNFDTGEPIGAILKVHIILMSLSFGLFFPIGLVLGLKKNRWHVPVQTTGGVLAIIGFVLGHAHGGRAFPDNAHSKFSWFMLWLLVAQLSAGGYLKAHTERRFNDKARPYIKIAHKYMAILMIIVSYAQILLGVIAYLGYCYDKYLGQCLAHLIMGSSFIAYGIWHLLLLRLASPWLNRFGRSPELYDSVMIMAWGLFNTFTEHNFLDDSEGWSHKDLQHTSLGIIWFCGGLLSTYMLRKASPTERSMFPAIILMVTGCAMGIHEQDTEFSTRVHFVFGLTLVLAGFTRCLEILLITTNLIRSDSKVPNPFQYLPSFFLCHTGMMLMSAIRQNIHAIDNIGIDIGTYSLGYMSISFLFYFYTYFLIQLFSELGKRQNKNMMLPSSEDDIAYHTVTQVSEVRSTSEEDSCRDPHVLFDANAEDTYDGHGSDADDVYQRAGTANGSSRSSDVIELGPMSRL
ncbi:hypothetical protein COEREDRAFT_80726 [Coemansia reversa NRRL 1564]|uniref:Cytochrome b561 domain-containing protein n=1 Tax=Coemansia reversa (strain ATCC 12441 / NRRL 1564) TaxID=763665 RepID=A0A2G5BDA3_COERN|nr:hypothetical protein COEREDRAFT_80726 [Coemansia reversa NRRL 1564]|eukprot:PIA16996.1 hypothetical protein COEREDRAFT_80726 [Coemansia reversa NRRL 1564]